MKSFIKQSQPKQFPSQKKSLNASDFAKNLEQNSEQLTNRISIDDLNKNSEWKKY